MVILKGIVGVGWDLRSDGSDEVGRGQPFQPKVAGSAELSVKGQPDQMLHSKEQQGGAAFVATSGTLTLAGPTAAMSSLLMAKKYLPMALVAMQLPAGLT
jgi:hypothetical protein